MGVISMDIERQILHIDLNHCYAQIEEMKVPAFREMAMAVGGNEENRHGIILAKNDLAKQYDIKTGESLREAYQKCPGLLIIHPDYKEYIYFTNRVKKIYQDYTDKVESFGLDEAWLDVSQSQKLFGNGYQIAKQIQQRVYNELGLTVSIGVSWNKIYSKLGSDLDKKMGLVHIRKDNYKDIVYPQVVQDLLYVGHATQKKLNHLGINTIGDLANYDKLELTKKFGKIGAIIWDFANGIDHSLVTTFHHTSAIKSIGNSITTKHDMTNYQEAEAVFYVLSESIASRLRDHQLKGRTISIRLRDCNLKHYGSRQISIDEAINTSSDIMLQVRILLALHYDFTIPLRSIGISVSNLEDQYLERSKQLSIFESTTDIQSMKQLKLEQAIDTIRNKYGYNTIKRANVLLHHELTHFNPKEEHTIHPESYFK